jgi:hypothetical protein
MSDIYLQITETPTVVTLSAPVISGALSSTVTVANTVTVALDSNSLSALENVTVTVGAAITGTVTVANFPSTQTIAGTVTANPTGTQTIAGTVTANVGGIASGVTVPVRLYAEQISGSESGQDTLVVCDSVGQLLVNATVAGSSVLGYDGYAYVSVKPSVGSSVTIGNTVTIAGTVTANPTGTQTIAGTVTANDSGALTIVNSSTVTKADVKFTTIAGAYNPTDVASSYVVRPLSISSTGKLLIDASADSGGGSVVGYDGNAFIRVAQSPQSVVTVGSLPAISGTVTANLNNVGGGYFTLYDLLLGEQIPVVASLASGLEQIGSVTASLSAGTNQIGAVTANTFAVQGTAVTTSNFTSTTASTVLANYNATREVLTIFNEGAGNLHICAGATCTTIAYQVRLSAGDYYEVPNHQTSLTHSAVFATAGTARVCQVS